MGKENVGVWGGVCVHAHAHARVILLSHKKKFLRILTLNTRPP